ncbi:Uncharacterised protein [Streptococcus pneumoniae]|nr:Uncharacterised protein [Streptococcus pneumoniae]
MNKVDYELEIEFDKDNQSALEILEYLGIKTQDSILGKNKRFVQELKRHQELYNIQLVDISSL